MQERICRVGVCGLIGAAALVGCTVGPSYERPEVAVSDPWHQRVTSELTSETPTLARWWDSFADPVLDELLERAIGGHGSGDGNLDLRIAAARVREARATRRESSGQYWPEVDAKGSYARSRQSEVTRRSGLPESVRGENDLWAAGFDATWEIDVFGRIRRLVESTTADADASLEAYRDTLVTLRADVALNYVEVRLLQERLRIAKANADGQTSTLELARSRVDAGIAPELDVSQARATLRSTEAQIPLIRAALDRATYRLDVLTGMPPGTLYELLATAQPVPAPPTSIAVGVRADLLRNRADIRQAERALAAQTARIGVATAELYPRFTLLGNFEWQARNTADMFSAPSQAWSFGPTIRWNLFQGDRIRAMINIEDARAEQAMHTYERTVLEAVEEVESTMASFVRERERFELLEGAVQDAMKSADLVQQLYDEGLVDYENVVSSQLTRLNLEDQLAANRAAVSTSAISLFKALGGDWSRAEAMADASE